MMFGPNLLVGHVSMLAEGGGGVYLFLTNQADNLLHSAFLKNDCEALWARLNCSLGHMWPPGLRLPTSALVVKVRPWEKVEEREIYN